MTRLSSLYDLALQQPARRLKPHTLLSLQAISRGIENTVMLERDPVALYVGLESLSRFVPHSKRYARIAQTAQRVVVFGVPDVPLSASPGVEVVPLPEGSALVREWFVIAHGQSYHSALVAQRIQENCAATESLCFKGIWTFSRAAIQTLEDALLNHLSRLKNTD